MNKNILAIALGVALLSGIGILSVHGATALNQNENPGTVAPIFPPVGITPGTPVPSSMTLVKIEGDRTAMIRGVVKSVIGGTVSVKSAACTWTVNAGSASVRPLHRGQTMELSNLQVGSLVTVLGSVTDAQCTVNARLIRPIR